MRQAYILRRFGTCNFIGLYTLTRRQVLAGVATFHYAVLGPIVSSALYLALFGIAAASLTNVPPSQFLNFIAPGLVILTIAEKAYETAAGKFIMDKHERTLGDWLSAPLSVWERLLALALAPVITGLLVGGAVAIMTFIFVTPRLDQPLVVLYFGVTAALFHGFIGTALGIWAEKWDQYSALLTFVLLPLAFLSGVFNRVSDMPEFAQQIIRLNPIFYMIDGFRYGVTGEASADPMLAAVVSLLVNLPLAFWVYRWLKSGYRLKA